MRSRAQTHNRVLVLTSGVLILPVVRKTLQQKEPPKTLLLYMNHHGTKARADAIARNQNDVSLVRNVCVLAHVDHGKTTLSDSLVAINGLISEKQAGKLRYLDRREDEQIRGITMEAHAVSLVYKNEYLINLIDSPGHVDFSADVSSAVRLCDGGLLVVDVVEGVCVQTCAVARVAWDEGITMCLVLNKIDRLCMELKLTPEEAHLHLHRIVESVNALLSGFVRKEELVDETKLFHPARGNVAFASGTDGWAFRIKDFLPLVAELTKSSTATSVEELNASLWELDCGWNGKQVVKISNPANTMFTNFVLRNIWTVYETSFAEPAKPKLLQNVMNVLKVNLQINIKDKKQTLRSIMNSWLPCGKCLCDMIVDYVPNPAQAQRGDRVDILLPGNQAEEAKSLVSRCDPEAPLIAFVSKMMAISETEFIALGRVFSGTLRRGMRLRVIGPKQTVEECNGDEVQPLLLLGGGTSDFVACDSIPSGNVFACAGLSKHILKTATLTTLDACPSLLRMPTQSAPLLRVSVEPEDPVNWERLTRGLQLLNKADPVLEVLINPSSGEHLLCAIGELHLDRCLKDLRELFAKVAFKVSPPMASFRETLKSRPKDTLPPVKWRHMNISATPMTPQFFKTESVVELCEDEGLAATALTVTTHKLLATNTNGNVLLLQLGSGGGSVDAYLDELISGFHFACRAGPLCEEPLRGVAFVVDPLPLLDAELAGEVDASGGAVAAALAEAFKRAFKENGSARLVEAVYKCEFNCLMDGEQLGNLYSVINRRRGKVVDEGMVEGTTSLFHVEALIPVVECYGIADELRTKTSGNASSPQLQFSHWEILPMDPYFTYTTRDDLESEGQTVDADRDNNLAYKLMIQVRKRKGLHTGEKIVVAAEKQRTLSKKV